MKQSWEANSNAAVLPFKHPQAAWQRASCYPQGWHIPLRATQRLVTIHNYSEAPALPHADRSLLQSLTSFFHYY